MLCGWCLFKESDEYGVVIPRLSPPPVVLGGKGTAAKPSNPPIRHVQFEISSSAVLKEDSPGPPGSLSRTSHSSTVDVLSSSLNSCEEVREQQMSRQLLAALNDDDLEDQQVGVACSRWVWQVVASLVDRHMAHTAGSSALVYAVDSCIQNVHAYKQ